MQVPAGVWRGGGGGDGDRGAAEVLADAAADAHVPDAGCLCVPSQCPKLLPRGPALGRPWPKMPGMQQLTHESQHGTLGNKHFCDARATPM